MSLVDDSYSKGFELLIGSTQIRHSFLGDNTKRGHIGPCAMEFNLGIHTSLVGDSMFEHCSLVEDLGVYSKLQKPVPMKNPQR
jgi:hypothetical protein